MLAILHVFSDGLNFDLNFFKRTVNSFKRFTFWDIIQLTNIVSCLYRNYHKTCILITFAHLSSHNEKLPLVLWNLTLFVMLFLLHFITFVTVVMMKDDTDVRYTRKRNAENISNSTGARWIFRIYFVFIRQRWFS